MMCHSSFRVVGLFVVWQSMGNLTIDQATLPPDYRVEIRVERGGLTGTQAPPPIVFRDNKGEDVT